MIVLLKQDYFAVFTDFLFFTEDALSREGLMSTSRWY